MRIATLLAALAIGALAPGAVHGPYAADEQEIAVDREAIGSFALTDHNGRRVTQRDFRGRFVLVFFGYTSCPDVCPTDLQVIGAALKSLGEAGRRVQPIFITLDPERDSPAVLARYVTHFHPRFLGLTGAPEAVALAAQAFGVVHVRAVTQDGRYTIDHSAITYLLGPDARFRAAFTHGIDPGRLAAGISGHLKEAGG